MSNHSAHLTLVDRLLLGKTFTFRSELSPVDCAARIEALNGRSEGDIHWVSFVQPSNSAEGSYAFELTMQVIYENRGGIQLATSHGKVYGVVKAGDKPGESHIAGVKRLQGSIWLFVAFMGLLELLLLPVLVNPQDPSFGGVLCIAIYLPALAGLLIVFALGRSQRMFNRLELALEASNLVPPEKEFMGNWSIEATSLTAVDRWAKPSPSGQI